jgi:hypothetical protein
MTSGPGAVVSIVNDGWRLPELLESHPNGRRGAPSVLEPKLGFLRALPPATANQAKGWVGSTSDAKLAPLRRGFFEKPGGAGYDRS